MDKVCGVSTVVGKSLASVWKWVCPRFQFIIRNHRLQRRWSWGRRRRPPLRNPACGGGGAAQVPATLVPLGGFRCCPLCGWAGGSGGLVCAQQPLGRLPSGTDLVSVLPGIGSCLLPVPTSTSFPSFLFVKNIHARSLISQKALKG